MTSAMQKDIRYRVTADQSQFDRGMKSAEQSAKVFERELAKLEKQQAAVERAGEQLGRGMVVAGAAIAAGLVLATKAAIEWESAWAGVAKVVDGSPEELGALEEELRGLAKVLPQTHTEIAAVASAAGQLGVAREDIADFTRVMIDMGVSTNLAAEEAAFALARMMNIMGTAPDDVRRLGSAIVDLGNNSATTEAEIVEMALRISGAGKAIGLSEDQVLGFSAALSSVGINAEAGGSAISKAFVKIDAAVRSGSDKLETFAATAGMTADDFKVAYEQDAAGAIQTFVAGLGRIQATGGDVFAILESLGMSEIRMRDAMLRLANAGDLLNSSLEVGARGWEENNALTAEAERRYATTEAKMQIARNQVVDFAIDIGQTFLPVIGKAAETVGGLADVVGGLPGPLKVALGIIGATTAALLLVGGAALIAVPKIAAYKAAVDTLAASQGRLAATTVAVTGAMGKATKLLGGPLGLALAGAATVLGVFGMNAGEASAQVDSLADTLDEATGAITDDTRVWIANELAKEGATDAARRLGIDIGDVVGVILGEADALERVNETLAEYGPGGAKFSDMTTQNTKDIEALNAVMGDLAPKLDDAKQKHADIASVTEDSSEAAVELTAEQQALADSFGVGAQEAEQLSDQIEALNDELDRLFGTIFGVEEASDALTRQYHALSESVEENGAILKGNSEEALNNRDAVRDVIKADFDYISALAEAGESTATLTAATEESRQRFVDQMLQLGFTKAEAERLAEAYDDIPETVKTTITSPGARHTLDDVLQLQDTLHRLTDRTWSVDLVQRQMAGEYTPGFAHGGEVPGPSRPVDAVPIMATGGEFVVRRDSAQPNLAALQHLNATGTLPAQRGGNIDVRVSIDTPGAEGQFKDFLRHWLRIDHGVELGDL